LELLYLLFLLIEGLPFFSYLRVELVQVFFGCLREVILIRHIDLGLAEFLANEMLLIC